MQIRKNHKKNIFNCPVCLNFIENYYIKKKIYNFYFKKQIEFNIKICPLCTFMFQSTLISKKKYENYYAKSINASSVTCNICKNEEMNNERIKFLKKNLILNKTISNILEIGGGDGIFLKKFKNKNVLNIEPSKKIKNFKAKTLNKNFEDVAFKNKFDLVLFFQTFEHVYDINFFFKKLYKISHKNTVFLLEIPNLLFKKNFAKNFVFEHISYFNKHSLTFFLNKNNYEILKFDKIGQNLRCLFKKKRENLNISKKINNFNSKKILNNIKLRKKTFIKNVENFKKIKKKIKIIIKKEKKVSIYGAGLHTLDLHRNNCFKLKDIVFFIDLNRTKNFFFKKKIIHPNDPEMKSCKAIIISSFAFEKKIYHDLKKKFKDKNIYKLYS